jgi:hypothetical protein
MEPEIVVPIAFFFFVIGLPVTLAIVSRYMAHQERMEYIRRGMVPPPMPPDPQMMRKAMKFGAWPPPGPPPTPGATFAPYYDPSFYAQHQLRRGIQVAFIGLALLIGLSFIGYHGGTYVYGPWLLGGLIPMFVGIAQIIGAVLSGAQLGNVNVSTGPPHAAQGAEPPPAAHTSGIPPSGPYAGWRPGPIPEIEKPPSPPDYRP